MNNAKKASVGGGFLFFLVTSQNKQNCFKIHFPSPPVKAAKGAREPQQHGRAVSKEQGCSLGAGANSGGENAVAQAARL